MVTVELMPEGARTRVKVTDQIVILNGGDTAAGRERGWAKRSTNYPPNSPARDDKKYKMKPEDSPLHVRRSILIAAPPERVWREFASRERMSEWWGKRIGTPEAGTAQGQWLDEYEPREGGRVRMSVLWGEERVSYGGAIKVFAPARELTFENDWIPNRGWAAPTYITLRLKPTLNGTLVELFHHGFERTGGDVAAEHAGYEQGWGVTQLAALKELVEK